MDYLLIATAALLASALTLFSGLGPVTRLIKKMTLQGIQALVSLILLDLAGALAGGLL